MSTLAQIIIMTSVFIPVIHRHRIDCIHFGVILVVCCEIGLLTPPVGGNL